MCRNFNRIKNHFSLILVLSCAVFYANAQKLNFEHLTVKNGLSRNSVLDIAQDGFGLMWFATGYGLNRYDGNRFTLYKNNPADTTSISDNYINALLCDSKKKLWIGTSGGLNSYEPITDSFKHIDLLPKNNSLQPEVFCIYEDKKHNLWVGTRNGLFVQLSGSSIFKHAAKLALDAKLASSEILCVYEDRFGYLWVGTGQGLVKSNFNGVFSQVSSFVYQPNIPGSISDSPVKSILEDNQGNIWMATESRGLNLLNRKTLSFEHIVQQSGATNGLVHNSIRKMTLDANGNFLIGTQGGISVFDPIQRTFTSYQNRIGDHESLSQNSIYSVFRDRSNNIWVGTYFGGINVSYGIKTLFKSIRPREDNLGMNHNVVLPIVHDSKGNLWIGTEGGGLNYYDRQTKKFTYYINNLKDPGSLASNFVKSIYIDKGDNIWVGTSGGGLNLFDPTTGKFRHFLLGKNIFESKRLAVLTMLNDSQNRLWIGGIGVNGVFHRKGVELSPIAHFPLMEKLKNEMILMLSEDKKGNIWIVTRKAIFCLNAANKLVSTLKYERKKGDEGQFNCIREDHNGDMWIGLYYGGLYHYNPKIKKIVARYTTKEGLCNDNVMGIVEDEKHNLWISTINGLSKLNPKEKTFQNYTTADGLPGDEFNYNSLYKAKNGELFFGGMNGLTHFFPDEISRNNYHAPLVFTGLKLFNKQVGIGKEQGIFTKNIIFRPQLVFSNQQNVFTLEFALLDYIKSYKNRYAYKLEGINQEWNETTMPQATYTNLPSGNYVFTVKGANNDGVWSKAVDIHIRILPPFWKTWWAYLIYACLIALIVFFIVRFFYLRQLLKRDEELHQIKLNFFTNISHEIRSHLSLIMIPLEKVIGESRQYDFINKQLIGVKKNADRLLSLVTELMDFRKAETSNLELNFSMNDLVVFLNDIYVSFKEVCDEKGIDFSFVHSDKQLNLAFDIEQLEKVVFNLLSNALKFTPIGGRIVLEVSVVKGEAIISVSDTGKGISPVYFDKLFKNYFQIVDSPQNTGYGIGLALSKHIIELHHGKITVDSKVGYTCFKVSLPFEDIPALTLKDEHTALEADKKFCILIVEDNIELRMIIKGLLKQEYRILESIDGRSALELAKTEIPDLVISDVMMPNMNGFELCHELKTDERTSHIPVILLTAKTAQADQINGLSTGADLYLTKPFSIKILQLNVRNILESREKISSKYRKQFIFAPSNILLNTMDEQFLSKLIAVIEEGMENREFGVDMLADRIGMSQSVLYKKVKALTDMTVNDFSKSIRLKKAAQLLKQTGYNVYEISSLVGFIDPRYFTKEFKKQFGQTPREYLNS